MKKVNIMYLELRCTCVTQMLATYLSYCSGTSKVWVYDLHDSDVGCSFLSYCSSASTNVV